MAWKMSCLVITYKFTGKLFPSQHSVLFHMPFVITKRFCATFWKKQLYAKSYSTSLIYHFQLVAERNTVVQKAQTVAASAEPVVTSWQVDEPPNKPAVIVKLFCRLCQCIQLWLTLTTLLNQSNIHNIAEIYLHMTAADTKEDFHINTNATVNWHSCCDYH